MGSGGVSHAASSSRMKRFLQCTEQEVSPSNLTNTAPAPQNDSHAWSSPRMKRHIQCVEHDIKHQRHPILFLQRKIKSQENHCCACHEKWNLNSPNVAPATTSDTWLCYSFDDSNTWRFYYLTILLLDDSISCRCYYLTLLVLDDSSDWLIDDSFASLTILLFNAVLLDESLILDDSNTWRFLLTWRF